MNKNSNIPQAEFETIERYINRAMDSQERAAFNTKINESPMLAAQVEEVKETILGIESAALSEKLDEFHQEINPVQKLQGQETEGNSNNFRKRFMPIAVAASIVLVLGVFWYNSNGSSSEKLFAKHFTPDPGLPTTMSTTDNYDFYEAMVDYKTKDYKTAIHKWELILDEKPANDTLNYFLGVANLVEGNDEKALSYLEKAANNNNSFLKSDIYFYLGLTYLKENNNIAAKESFKVSGSDKSLKILSEIKE